MLYCGKIIPCFYHRGKSTKGGTCMSEICIIVTIVASLTMRVTRRYETEV